MRYNKQELVALASQTSQNFEREGVLILKERQDSFFRRSEGYSARWFRLRGNLLFYLKGPEPWYEPLGLIVLGNHQLSVQTQDENGHWPFQIVWTNGVCYHMGTFLESERTLWLKAMELAPYEQMSQRIVDLHQQLDDSRTLIDLRKFRITNKIITDFNEVPLCEMSLSCDNLVCDGSGKPPSSFAAAFVLLPDRGICVRYCCTEVVERCSNPCYSRTVMFRGSDGLIVEAFIRIVVYDVKEVVSQTGVAIGSVTLRLNHIQEAQRLRIPLMNAGNRAVGFVTINGWSLESPQVGPCPMHSEVERNPTINHSIDMAPKVLGHRRSESLPSRLGLNLKYPSYDWVLCQNFMNPFQATYRFKSGLGGDITVHEAISEPRFCFTMPLQLLNIYMDREKEQLESMLAFAEIGKRVAPRNLDFASHVSLMRLFHAAAKAQALFTAHLSVLKVYKTAKKAMMISAQASFFKPSPQKDDEIPEEPDLGFVPINLHLQRMWVHNDTLNKTGFHDVVTVGAFTSHTHRSDRPGGLIKLLQQFKDMSSEKSEKMEKAFKVNVEYEKLHAMKTLRNAAVDKMGYVLDLFREGKVNEAPTVVDTVKEHLTKYIGLWNEDSCEAALSSIGWNKKRIDPETEAVRLTEQLAEHARLAAENTGPLGSTGNTSDSSSVFDLIQILAALKTTCDSEATLGTSPQRSPILGITTAPTAMDTTPGSSSAMEITTVLNAANATSGTSSGLGATTAPNATEATPVASPTQGNTNASSASKTIPVASPAPKIFNAPSSSKATPVAPPTLENTNASSASKATPVASPAPKTINAPSSSKATPVASPAMEATTFRCGSSTMGVKHTPVSWQINKELLTKLKIIDSSGSDSTVKVSAALRASLLGPDIGFASEDAAGAGPSTSASQLFSFGSSSSSSMDTTPTVEMASALSASVPDMQFKGNEFQFQTDKTPRGDRSEGSAGSSGKGKGIGKHRKNNSGDGKVNDDNSSNAERADRGHSFRGAIPKTTEVPPPLFERNGSLRSGAKSSTSLAQASKKGPVNNKKDKKKADKKKAKKNRRELEKQIQTRHEIDPAIRLNNLKFFQNMTSAMTDMFQRVCNCVNHIIATGTCSDAEEVETRSLMELLVRLMDEAYKWTRMAHAALRIETDTPAWTIEHASLQSRRDICFSQALTTVTAGLMCWLTTEPEDRIVKTVKTGLGVLCGFEGLLSLYALEKTMWGDMVIAIEDLHTVLFKLVPIYPGEPIIPQVIGFRKAILVELPVADSLYNRFKDLPTFTIAAPFFNIGINEKASVAEALGDCKQQHHSNADSMELLSTYYARYTKVFPNDTTEPLRVSSHSKPLEEVMENLRAAVQKRASRNVEVLQLATLATRLMHGVRFTSCKSAKDRTGMSITLEQTNILSSEYHLADEDRKKALDVMRSEGCRRENALKNIGLSKYAFTKSQVQSLPEEYRPPHGSYGTTLT